MKEKLLRDCLDEYLDKYKLISVASGMYSFQHTPNEEQLEVSPSSIKILAATGKIKCLYNGLEFKARKATIEKLKKFLIRAKFSSLDGEPEIMYIDIIIERRKI